MNILVVGDVMIDEYVRVAIDRISPEAPIPVMRHLGEYSTLGGAANVAANINSLGGRSRLVGVLGQQNIFGIQSGHLGELSRCVTDPSRSVTIKRRFVAQNQQQVARLDIESTDDISPEVQDQVIKRALDDVVGCDAVVFSDYCKGVVTERVAKAVIGACKGGCPVIVDTKRSDLIRFYGAHIFTPNEREYDLIEHIPSLGAEVIVTLADRGAKWRGEIIPTQKVNVADVTGAGDTFVAAIAVRMAEYGILNRETIQFANRAAAVAVTRRGTAVVRRSEL